MEIGEQNLQMHSVAGTQGEAAPARLRLQFLPHFWPTREGRPQQFARPVCTQVQANACEVMPLHEVLPSSTTRRPATGGGISWRIGDGRTPQGKAESQGEREPPPPRPPPAARERYHLDTLEAQASGGSAADRS